MALSVETLVLAEKAAKNYTDAAVAGAAGGINYKGAVDYYSQLPSSPAENDAYTVKYAGVSPSTEPDGTEYVWASYEGTLQWIPFGPDLSQYQKVLVSGTNIKTVNNQTILGSGDLSIEPGISQADADQRYLQLSGGTITGTIIAPNNSSVMSLDASSNLGIIGTQNSMITFGNANRTTVIKTASNREIKRLIGNDYFDILDTSNTSANPTLSGGETVLTSLKLDGINYSLDGGSGGSSVIANPTMSGSEDSLTGLEVDGTKYKVAADITVDSALSDVSENPVQNKVITSALNGKSTVSVSNTGTAVDEISYITIDGTEKKIAGGGSGSTVANVAFEQMYDITTDVTNGTYTGDTLVSLHCNATLTITPDTDYQLPTTISVVGCDYTYDNITGVIALSQATDDVTITATCVASV